MHLAFNFLNRAICLIIILLILFDLLFCLHDLVKGSLAFHFQDFNIGFNIINRIIILKQVILFLLCFLDQNLGLAFEILEMVMLILQLVFQIGYHDFQINDLFLVSILSNTLAISIVGLYKNKCTISRLNDQHFSKS